MSAQIASRVDVEISALVDAAYDTAKSILLVKKERLIAIAEHLIEVETIDGTELDDMLFAQPAVSEPPLTLEELAG